MAESQGEADHHVPVIDMSKQDAVAAQDLFQALSTVGFACLKNTGLWHMAEDYATKSREFFELPAAEKNKYSKPNSAYENAGWASIGREQLSSERPGDYKEIFNMDAKIEGDPARAPPQLDTEECWTLWAKFEEECDRVLYLIGLGLGLKDPYQLVKTHSYRDPTNNSTTQRIAWYPKVEMDAVKPGQIRCGEHSDYGSITLLYSNAPGLQVMNRQLGEYVDAGYIEGGIFVNIGDMLQMWSGDVLIASKHRVLIPEEKYLNQDRVSIAFFGQPDDDTLIETLDGSGKYPPIISGNWLTDRFTATYDK